MLSVAKVFECRVEIMSNGHLEIIIGGNSYCRRNMVPPLIWRANNEACRVTVSVVPGRRYSKTTNCVHGCLDKEGYIDECIQSDRRLILL